MVQLKPRGRGARLASGMKRSFILLLSIFATLASGQPQDTPKTPPAQSATQSPPAVAQGSTKAQPAPFKSEELEQIVAPIALYPDALLAQVFMASTYPLEIVYAARWSKEHPQVKGDAVAKEMEKQTWDASVKSLVAFPDVLAMMNEKLDWTQKLGDAFLAQRKELMDAVQRLRTRAKEAGHLESGKEQTVRTDAAPAGATAPQVIVIESSSPEVIYVPTYNPTVVYGAWPYPAYPPYYYYPPGYAAGAAFFSFSVGMVVGGALWGGCNWGYGDVDVNVNRYNNFNRNTNINSNRNVGNRGWQHDASHRGGVGYRDQATQQKFGQWGSQEGIQSREAFRGRSDSGNQLGTRDGAGSAYRDLGGAQARDAGDSTRAGDFDGSQGSRASRQEGSAGGPAGRDPGASSRSTSPGAFEGVGNGAGTRASSSRGAGSRGGMSRGGGGRRR